MRILYLSHIMTHDHPRRSVFPDEAVVLAPLFAELGMDVNVVDATYDRPLPDPTEYGGVIVGGSVGSANDTEPWRLQLREWLRTWQSVPFLGLCGGHQLLAHALGSRVIKLSRPQVGVHPLPLSGIPGFAGFVIQAHSEHVVDVPPGADVWAEDAAGIQVLRYPGHRWTAQFHAEMPADIARGCGKPLGATPESWPEPELMAAVESGKAFIRAWYGGLPKA